MGTKEKIAYAIARESADDRTLQNQYDKLQAVAKKFGYRIIKRFGENVSGDATKRDGAFADFIENLMLAIKKQKPDAILITSLDRLTRTTREQGYFLTEFSSIQKIPMYFAKENVWTIDPISGVPNEDGMRRLASDETPQRERENIAARTRPQREKLGAQGYFIGHISDGYCVKETWGTYDDGRRRKIKEIDIDVERAKVIEDIYRYYLNGESTDKIAAILNANNVPTANRYRSEHPNKFGYKSHYIGKDKMTYERKNAAWSGSLVAQVLSNQWYKGIRYYRKQELHHKYIIEPELWDEVKRIREERKVSFRNLKESSKHIFLLSNMFFCGKCGCKMYGHYTGLNNHYYCSSIETKQDKCGLKGVCKENIEGIIYHILKEDAEINVLGGAMSDNDAILSFFKLSKEKESQYKESIKNNNKIIQKLTLANETNEKSIAFLISQQSLHSENATRVAMYESEITKNEHAIEVNKRDIVKCQLENKKFNSLLSSTADAKQILRNIEKTKDLHTIKQLFKVAIEKVYIFNSEKRNSIIRIYDRRGGIREIAYSAAKLKGKYLPLVGLQYNEKTNLIEPIEYPIIASDLYLFGCESEEGMKSMVALHEKFDTPYTYIDKPISVDSYIELLKNSRVAFSYSRLEELSDLAITQREHYKQWRKKYNSGRPTSEPYIIHNETYAEIQKERKQLYNRRYKIKKHKSLSDDEKKLRLEEIERKLDALTVQVPLIKPRKKCVVVAAPTIVED